MLYMHLKPVQWLEKYETIEKEMMEEECLWHSMVVFQFRLGSPIPKTLGLRFRPNMIELHGQKYETEEITVVCADC